MLFSPHWALALCCLGPCQALCSPRTDDRLTFQCCIPWAPPEEDAGSGGGVSCGLPLAVGMHLGCRLGLPCAAHIVWPALGALGLSGYRVTQKAVPQVNDLRRTTCDLVFRELGTQGCTDQGSLRTSGLGQDGSRVCSRVPAGPWVGHGDPCGSQEGMWGEAASVPNLLSFAPRKDLISSGESVGLS